MNDAAPTPSPPTPAEAAPRGPRSVLGPAQRGLLLAVLAMTGLLLASSAFLFLTTPAPISSDVVDRRYETSLHGATGIAPFGDETARTAELSGLYQSVLLAHVIGGLLLLVPAVVFVAWHLPAALRRRRPRTLWSGAATAAIGVALVASGLFILTEANSLQHTWIFRSHQLFALALPLAYLGHRAWSVVPPSRRAFVIGIAAPAGLTVALLVAHAATAPAPPAPSGGAIAGQTADDPFLPFTPANAVADRSSPFWPSQATTQTGEPMPRRTLTLEDVSRPDLIAADIERYGFIVNDSVGSATCGRCHAAIVAQWARSAHRFSSFNNPFYRASVEALRDEEDGEERSQWCGGCHDPVLMFAGKMRGEVDPLWPESQAGLTCLSCHVIDRIHGKGGNGNYRIADERPSPYLFAGSKDGAGRSLHDALVRSKPTVHRRRMLGKLHRTSEVCLPCHKVALDLPVNDYRWLRGQNEYDAWHDSGVSRNASRTFYLPEDRRVCQDCHMPLVAAEGGDVSADADGRVRSHLFGSANTALPFIRGDDETLAEVEAALGADVVGVDLFALRREGGGLVRALDPSAPSLAPGESVEVHVVVRNRGVGHRFPGGTIDSNEAWLELIVEDAGGAELARSGALDLEGVVDDEAHAYKALFVTKEGEPALVRNPQHFHAPIYVRTIGPGTADIARYRIRVPEAPGTSVRIRARLLWRKFSLAFTRFTFERLALPRIDRFDGVTVPALPVTTIAEDEVTVAIAVDVEAARGNAVELRPEDWVRWNDYGIGSLLQGDLRAAKEAFGVVASLAPERPDGPRNLARVAVAEGSVREAFAHLQRSEELAEGDPQSAWVWGSGLLKAGKLDEALAAFQRVAAFFPEDRAAWRAIGRIHYVAGRYRDALTAFLRALAIDPEDRIAHYHRMLCYRALGEKENAADAEKAYLKYQIDESAEEVTQAYRLANPVDNREAQALHVHDLTGDDR